MSTINKLYNKNLISLQQDFTKDIIYEGVTGSVAYGCNMGDSSDEDMIAITVPPLAYIFPTLSGHIPGFGDNPPSFNSFQQHHIMDGENQYDVSLYSIVNFFELAAKSNPNVLESLFLPERCVTHIDKIGKIMVENRHLFLSKYCKFKYAGYSHSQLAKAKSTVIKPSRKALVETLGYDSKYLSHVIRLGLQAEQILTDHNLVLDLNGDLLKDIRRGEWTFEQIEEWSTRQQAKLDELYETSTLQHSVDYGKLQSVLLNCLEEKFGNLSNIIKR